MSGIPGPVPTPSDQRRRVNQPEIPIDKDIERRPAAPYPADARWHPTAIQWYDALAESGQSDRYQQSDWATAYFIAEVMSRDLLPTVHGVDLATGVPTLARQQVTGASVQAFLKACTALLATEGDRRRLRIELAKGDQKTPDLPDGVPSLDDYRDRTG